MHECPKCGKMTDGSWSEGGLKWAICDDCMSEEQNSQGTKDQKGAIGKEVDLL